MLTAKAKLNKPKEINGTGSLEFSEALTNETRI